MTTIKDVAKRCGLSAMTVSSVLNNRHGEASPQTRQKVLKAVEEMGYQPNAVARGLIRRRMNTLGIVMAYGQDFLLANHKYLNPVLDGIFSANRQNHQKSLVIAEDNWTIAHDKLHTYLDGHCDGLIFLLPTAPTEMYLTLVKRSFPFVIIGDDNSEPGLPLIDLDNVQAGFDATKHLIEYGHRRIACLTGTEWYRSSGEREEGYCLALQQAGIAVDDRLILAGEYTVESGFERTMRLLAGSSADRPTALFCGDDTIAEGAYRAVRELGRQVPRDVSIVGINDDLIASQLEPGLSTIRQPFRQYGFLAVEMTLAQVNRKPLSEEKIRVRGEFVRRESVMALND